MCWLIHRGADRFQLAPVLHPTPSFFFNCQICDRKLLQAHHHGRVVYRVYLLLKCRNIALLTKVHKMKAMVFPVVMYGCESWTLKKAEYWRMDAFKLLCWRGSCPLDCKEIKPVNPKGNQPWKFIGRTDAEAELQYFGHLMWRSDSLEKSLMLERLRVGRERGNGGWIASPTQWTWVWPNSEIQWRAGNPGALQSLGLQRVRYKLVMEQQKYICIFFLSSYFSWTELKLKYH